MAQIPVDLQDYPTNCRINEARPADAEHVINKHAALA